MSAGHGVRDQKAAHLSRHLRRHRSGEEEPGVGAVSGTGALHGYRNSVSLARLAEGSYVFPPAVVVEVHGEEPAPLVLEHGIDAHDLLALEVLKNFCVVDRQEGLVRAFAAGRPAAANRALLLADAADPFVGANGRVPGLPGLRVFPASRKDIGPAPKERAKEANLLGGVSLLGPW